MSSPTGLCLCGCGAATAVYRGKQRKYRHGHAVRLLRGPDSPGWKGGRTRESRGYVNIRMPDHPRANSSGYVVEHILVVEAALGHAFPRKAEIHHVDEDRSNNANSNLVLCENRAYHRLLHRRQRALDACGDANARSCNICGDFSRQDQIVVTRYGNVYHRDCKRDYGRRRYHARAGAAS